MNRSISAKRKDSDHRADRQVLVKVLSEVGIVGVAESVATLNLAGDQELLSRLSDRVSHDHALSNSIADLERREISIFTRWPLGNDLKATEGVFVILGDSSNRAFTTAVSSRLGRALDRHPEWFAALRTFCVQMKPETCLLIAPGQYTYRFLHRLADLLEVRQAILLQTTVDQFGKRFSEALSLRQTEFALQPTCILRVVATDDLLLSDDQCVATCCREVRSLFCRPNGNIHRLLGTRLGESAVDPMQRTMIFSPSTSNCPKHIESLLNRGAIAWHVFDSHPAAPSPNSANDLAGQSSRATILRLDELEQERFVSHFTRRQRGAWLDESEANYLDSLLLGDKSRHRGPLASLLRIVVQQQLIAGNCLTRDQTRVVCFSNRPLSEFRSLRSFRSHLARWDFEPYGIAIERDVLQSLGARPVVYGNESAWERLNPSDRPFFQFADGVGSDWTFEDEWRIVGDLDLTKLKHNEAVVFVATAADARELAPFCRWPIVVLND